MKFLLLFVPLLATQPTAGAGYVNVRLGYCCAEMYAHHNRDCWQTYSYRGASYSMPAKMIEQRAADHPVAIQAAMDELIQRAQFDCDGNA